MVVVEVEVEEFVAAFVAKSPSPAISARFRVVSSLFVVRACVMSSCVVSRGRDRGGTGGEREQEDALLVDSKKNSKSIQRGK